MKLGKEEISKLVLEYQSKFESTLPAINNKKTDLSKLRKCCKKLEPNPIVTKEVSTKVLERKC